MKKSILSRVFVFVFATLFCVSDSKGQSTFSVIHNILQSKCSNSGCHSATTSDGLDFSLGATEVYSSLIDSMPLNGMARTSGYRSVDPGYPSNSFLLKKLIHALDGSETLATDEGDTMSTVTSKNLTKEEIELIRQWIIYGAQYNGAQVDTSIIAKFYNGLGMNRIPRPSPPAPGKGFQLHFGPVLMAPQHEFEYYKKEDLRLTNDIEVINIDIKMNIESHHFILYKYIADSVDNFKEGLRPVDDLGDAAEMSFSSTIVAIWQNERPHELPEGTAYKWKTGTVVDLNVHMINPERDSILASEAYLNVYTQPTGTAEQEMHSGISYYLDDNGLPFGLNILNNAKDTTFVLNDFDSLSTETYYFWLIQGHTHQIGTSYDIWRRNPDGSLGDPIYKGTYNQLYEFDQGFYDWQHPPVRYFNPLLPVKRNEGFIHKASYFNDGPAPIGFGLTTKDEMFAAYYQYTSAPTTTSVKEKYSGQNDINIFPNPSTGKLVIDASGMAKNGTYTLEIFNLLGSRMLRLDNLTQQFLTLDINHYISDVYLVKLTSGTEVYTSKFIKQ